MTKNLLTIFHQSFAAIFHFYVLLFLQEFTLLISVIFIILQIKIISFVLDLVDSKTLLPVIVKIHSLVAQQVRVVNVKVFKMFRTLSFTHLTDDT